MVKISFYVPVAYLDPVKVAMFDAGAGRIGGYEFCSWETLGRGQFRPKAGSSPFVGDIDRLEVVDEYQVEMVCADENAQAVINALRRAHPYEEPAFGAWKLLDFDAS